MKFGSKVLVLRGSWSGRIAQGEPGYNPRAIGDGGLALGLTQIHWFHRWGRGCVLDPDLPRGARARRVAQVPDSTHPIGNALCWLTRVRQAADHWAARGCRTPWRAGWGWIATGRHCCGCWSHRHLARLRRWQRAIERRRDLLVALPHGPTWGSDTPF